VTSIRISVKVCSLVYKVLPQESKNVTDLYSLLRLWQQRWTVKGWSRVHVYAEHKFFRLSKYQPLHLTSLFVLFTGWILKGGSGMEMTCLNWRVWFWNLKLGSVILLFSIPLRRFRLWVTAVHLFSTVIIQTIPLKATHAAKHALSTNYELKCEPVFCPRLSLPEAPFLFFALYDVRIRSAQLIRNKILREIAGGEKTSNYTFNYPVIIIVI